MPSAIASAAKLLWYSLDKRGRVVDSLPPPSGPFDVGTRRIYLADTGRTGVYTGDSAPRTLPVQIFYPAGGPGAGPAPYLPQKGIMQLYTKIMGMPNLFSGLDSLSTHSQVDAPFLPEARRAPLVIFSHGYTAFEMQNLLQMEHLASCGYVVASICHTHEAFAACMEDGTVTPFYPPRQKEFMAMQRAAQKSMKAAGITPADPRAVKNMVANPGIFEESMAVWADDTIFVLDALTRLALDPESPFFEAFNPTAAGVFGHSFGGATAGEAARRDSRFACWCNMDGAPYGPTSRQAIQAPGLLLTAEHPVEAGYPEGTQNIMVVQTPTAKHVDYTDFGFISPLLKRVDLMLGTVPAAEMQEIMNGYLLSFFNTFLRGRQPDGLMKGQSKNPHTLVRPGPGWPCRQGAV